MDRYNIHSYIPFYIKVSLGNAPNTNVSNIPQYQDSEQNKTTILFMILVMSQISCVHISHVMIIYSGCWH